MEKNERYTDMNAAEADAAEETAQDMGDAASSMNAVFDEDRAETIEQRREKMRNAFKFPEEAQRGVLKLFKPLLSKDKEYMELHYDFAKLSGKEMIDALDVEPNADNNSSLTNKQALFLFSMACGKMERGISGLDAIDIRTQLSPRDMIGAVRIGKSFFAHSLVGAQLSIFKM